MKLFHYTDQVGYKSIIEDGFIRKSMGSYGVGVYLTDLDPDHHEKEKVATLLFGPGAKLRLPRGGLDHHVVVNVPSTDPSLRWVRDHVYLYVVGNGRGLSLAIETNDRWTKLALAGLLVLAVVVSLFPIWLALAIVGQAVCVRFRGRRERTLALKKQLDFLLWDWELKDSFRVQDTPLSICCKRCSNQVTKKYGGGFLVGSKVDGFKIRECLRAHTRMHKHQGELQQLLSSYREGYYQSSFEAYIASNSAEVSVRCRHQSCLQKVWKYRGSTSISARDKDAIIDAVHWHSWQHWIEKPLILVFCIIFLFCYTCAREQ